MQNHQLESGIEAGQNPPEVREELPNRWHALLFSSKAWVFRLKRWWQEWNSLRHARLERRISSTDFKLLAESRSALYPSQNASEFALQAGKVQNLRVAARSLNGLVLPAGTVFSFWANVPRPTRRRGFVNGRELREGCLIANLGGGLCQLSNALYDSALKAGCEIVERHAHSRRVPGSIAAAGRDATVFWNYVDLRFRSRSQLRLEIRVEPQDLIVRFQEFAGPSKSAPRPAPAAIEEPAAPVESCETCGQTDCFRNASVASSPRKSCTAWLVDAFQPEPNAWMMEQRSSRDWLLLPFNSSRFKIGRYCWDTREFTAVREARWTVLRRSLTVRRLAAQGAARQRALLQMEESMAFALAHQVPAAATHLVISQNLLPFLWMRGDLGGRTFDVMMTRLPLVELERVLDRAAAAHPQSKTLADFRAPRQLIEAESEALSAARYWITPHSQISRLAGARAVQLRWKIPEPKPARRGKWIIFAASTLGRKGAWELRQISRELDLPVRLVGPVLEDPGFWEGVQTERAGFDWLDGAGVVVLPAWVEHQPRRLLQAVAAGIPVLATDACGLAGMTGVVTIPTGDVDALRNAILAEAPTGAVTTACARSMP